MKRSSEIDQMTAEGEGPLVVSSGASPLHDTESNECAAVPRHAPIEAQQSEPSRHRRRSSASNPPQHIIGGEVAAKVAVFAARKAGHPDEGLGKETAGAAPPTATEEAPSPKARFAGNVRGVTRKKSTVRVLKGIAESLVSGRASIVTDIIPQQGRQQQPAEEELLPANPAWGNSIIQAEGQQQCNRGVGAREREKIPRDLFRGVPTLPGHPLCSDAESFGSGKNSLWTTSNTSEQDFLLSSPVEKVDWFVSHAWARDHRDKLITASAEFAELKAAELKDVLEDIAAENRALRRASLGYSRMDEMLMKVPSQPSILWIDKFCVSPDVLERRLVVERHIDYFLAHSEGFLVLLSSGYFRRLWCVYEWGHFVATSGASTLDRFRVCLSWLCCSPNFQVPLVANDIETLSVEGLECSELSDGLCLRSAIATKYLSLKAFERMVQVSALCILAKSYAILALDFCTAGHPDLENAWRAFDCHIRWRRSKFLLPWRRVAEKLGLPGVCSGLDNFWDKMQQSTKMSAEGAQLEDGSNLYYVAAPPVNRLRFLASSAAHVYLAVLTNKARASAVVVGEDLSGAARMTLSTLLAKESAGAAGVQGGGAEGGEALG